MSLSTTGPVTSKASDITNQTQNQYHEESKSGNPLSKAIIHDVADDVDKDFFNKSENKKMKLNKGEKRALKFELKNGADLSEVPDLKQYLQGAVAQQAINPNAREVKSGGKAVKKQA